MPSPPARLHTFQAGKSPQVGGLGLGSHLTRQLLGGVEYDVSSRWSLSAGWRHLDISYDHKGFVFDSAMDGPILGAVYRF